jgi:hypothetical protein
MSETALAERMTGTGTVSRITGRVARTALIAPRTLTEMVFQTTGTVVSTGIVTASMTGNRPVTVSTIVLRV